MLSVLATLPSASTTLTDAGAWSSYLFSDLWAFLAFAAGLSLFAGLAGFFLAGVSNIFKR